MGKNELIANIRYVLFNEWDPIGIGDNSNLSDEYDGYIGSIISMLKQKSPVESIATFLKNIEKTEMGIDVVDIKSLHNVASKIKEIGNML